MKLIQYTLPIYWASYLINGDATGFDIANTPQDPEAGTREQQEIDSWLASEGHPQFTGVSEDTWFAHTNDATSLGGDVATYTAYFTTEEENEEHRARCAVQAHLFKTIQILCDMGYKEIAFEVRAAADTKTRYWA